MTPGGCPLAELATRVATLAGIPAGALEADLRTDPVRIIRDIRQALLANARRQADALGLPPAADPMLVDLDAADQQAAEPGTGSLTAERQAAAGPRLLLIVDQFEELFTQCTDEQERRKFIKVLCAAAGVAMPDTAADGGPIRQQVDAPKAPALVVIGLRADYYARTTDYPELVPHLQDRPVLVGPIDEAGLRQAIEKPAAMAGLVADAALAERLLADLSLRGHPDAIPTSTVEDLRDREAATGGASYEAGRLALLSYALQQTWHKREARHLTVAGYLATGGIDGAVARAADKVYHELDTAGQDTLQRVLLRLVALGEEGTPDSRRRVTLAELTDSNGSARATSTRAVLDKLIDARLVTADEDTVEITHETLLTAWPRLRKWLTDDRDGQRIHRDLTYAARDWHADRDSGRLFRGTRLAVARDWAADHDQDLNDEERAFLAASQHDQLRTTRRRRAAVGALAVLTALSGTAAGIAVQNAANANRQAANAARQHAIALSRQLAAESLTTDPTDPMTARQLAVAAWHIFPTNQADSAMTTLLAEQQQDGRLPAATAHNGVNGVAFSPDGKLLASADGGRHGAAVEPGHRPARRCPPPRRPRRRPTGGVTGVAFSPDGKLLATAGTDGTVRLWNPATGQPVGAPSRLTGPADARA